MNYQQALQAIREVENAGRTELSLTRAKRDSTPIIGGLKTWFSETFEPSLEALPPEIGQLTNLECLGLSDNLLESLPLEIVRLTNLKRLFLADNQLKSLLPEIGLLTNLEELNLGNNQLKSLPPEIARLTNLKKLNLGNNQLKSLPSEIGQLTNLASLDLHGNRLESLPSEIGRLTILGTQNLVRPLMERALQKTGALRFQMQIQQKVLLTYEHLRIDDNPLKSPPAEIVNQGTNAVLTFLQAQLEGGRKQWRAKLVVVGEGGAGKTSLLRRLCGVVLAGNGRPRTGSRT